MKKLRKSICLSLCVACLMFVSGIFTACGANKVNLTAENDTTTLKPGQSVQLLVENKAPENYTFNFNEGENLATISSTGVLTVKDTATPGEKIKIIAKKDQVKSNELTITVGSINLTSLTASADGVTEVLRNNYYDLTYTKAPSNTTETISWIIVEGEDYAEIAGNKLIIKSTASNNSTIKIKAQGETISSNILEFTVVEYSSEGLYLVGEDEVEVLDSAQSNYTYTINVKNSSGYNVPDKDLTYSLSSADEALLDVTQTGYNFVLKAIGHGTATLRINLGENYHEVTVNCIKAPDAVTLPEVLQTKNTIEFKTAVNAEISDFNFNLIGTNVCQNLSYTFEKWNDSDWCEETTAGEFGTYSNGTLTLKTQGKIRLTATSNSGSVIEKSAQMTFVVNDGVNVKTFDEFHTAVTASTGKAINIVNMQTNKLFPSFVAGTQNASDVTSLNIDVASGKLLLNGNGYEIDISGVRKLTDDEAQDNLGSFLKVAALTNGNNFVKIYDLTLTGNAQVDDSGITGKYNRAIEIGGDKELISYAVEIDNIKVSQFGVGIRVSHAISTGNQISKISNATIQNIWSNGIETAASQIAFDTINIGLCGGCGFEITPDNFNKAGVGFNELQDVKFLGQWNVNNINNGNTKYFDSKSMNVSGTTITVPMIISGSITGKNAETISNIMNSEFELNMIALKFNDFKTASVNASQVSLGIFSESIINFNDLSGIDTTHKYIELSLAQNLGSIILYNWNYQGE